MELTPEQTFERNEILAELKESADKVKDLVQNLQDAIENHNRVINKANDFAECVVQELDGSGDIDYDTDFYRFWTDFYINRYSVSPLIEYAGVFIDAEEFEGLPLSA